MRLQVWNKGRSTAKNVEVVLEEIFEFRQGAFRMRNDLVPADFRWTNQPPDVPASRCDLLPPRIFKLCDFAVVTNRLPDEWVARIGARVEGEPQVAFTFTLNPFPSNGANILAVGEYLLKITAVAENAKPNTVFLYLRVGPEWFPDEKRMLEEGLVLRAPCRSEMRKIVKPSVTM
jgi:hypothetical protein